MTSPIFSPAVARQLSISREQLSAVVKSYQQDLQTGLLEVNLPDLVSFDFVFARGQMVNIYQRDDVSRRLALETFLDHFPKSEGTGIIRALSLTPQAIRLAKILLEQVGAGEPTSLPTRSLESRIEKWTARPNPALVHICWPNAEALALLPGDSHPPRHTLFMTSGQIFHSSGGMMTLYGWKEENCTATLYSSESQTDAWQEYVLHYAFISVTNYLLSRVGETSGRLLLDAVIHETNFAAAGRDWKFSLTPESVTDQMLFSTIHDAAQTYSQLIRLMLNQVEPILGDDLLKSLIQEATMAMQPTYCKAFQENLSILEPIGVWPANVKQGT